MESKTSTPSYMDNVELLKTRKIRNYQNTARFLRQRRADSSNARHTATDKSIYE